MSRSRTLGMRLERGERWALGALAALILATAFLLPGDMAPAAAPAAPAPGEVAGH